MTPHDRDDWPEPRLVEREPDRHGRFRGRDVVLGAVSAALLGALVTQVYASQDDAQQERTEHYTLARQVDDTCRSGGAAARELEDIGACEQAADAAEDKAAVITSAPPSDDQVRGAVAAYLDDHPPAAGRPPTDAEVDAAVQRVCAAIGCRGEDGRPGDAAAPPSDDQVRSAVAAWCAVGDRCLVGQDAVQDAVQAYCETLPAGSCQGPQGEAGTPGPVLSVYYVVEPGPLGDIIKRCVLQPAGDAAEPPRYRCAQE